MFAVELQSNNAASAEAVAANLTPGNVAVTGATNITTLFVTPDIDDPVVQDSFNVGIDMDSMLGLRVPFFYFSAKVRVAIASGFLLTL